MKAEQPKEDYQPIVAEPLKEPPAETQEKSAVASVAIRMKIPKGPDNDDGEPGGTVTIELDGKPYFKAPPKSSEQKTKVIARGADNLKEYAQFLDGLMDAPDPAAKTAELEKIVVHLL